MADAAPSRKLVCFGGYEADLRAGDLRKRGVKIRLRDQSFEILAILLERPGEVVTREDLRRRLWPADVFVDFDNNLNSAVARLREALNDPVEHPRFIETLPKRGYRFIGNISGQAASKPKLVVLPFINLSGDPSREYFSAAVTEEITSQLAVLAPEQLGVIARTTAMHFRGSDKEIREIGRELAVDYVVEGSVREAGDRIVLNAQLIQAGDQTHLWADRYDIELREIFGIENAVAQAVAAKIGITSNRAARKPTEDLEAYNLYIQGRYLLDKTGPPQVYSKARECFEQAVARDPSFALAYDSLGELYWMLGLSGFMPPKETLTVGIFHVLRALEIDNTLAETHALLGQYRKQLDFDWPEVRREMSRALQLNPASPLVRVRYAVTGLMPHGRIQEAVHELESAVELDPRASSDPRSSLARFWLAIMLWLGRQYDRGIEQAQLVLKADPNYYLGHFVTGLCYREKRMFDEAVAAQRKATELVAGAPLMLGWLGLALAQAGNTAEARSVLEKLHAMATQACVPPTSFAWIHFGLGEKDDFFSWMDRAIDARDHMLMPIKSYPFLDPIRSDARYLGLLRRMNLKP